MKVIALFGEPGCGKTTLMREVMRTLDIDSSTLKEDFKLVPYHKKGSIYVLGKYEDGEVFAGTDRMSMAVQPEAIKFLESIPSDSIVLFEGDRLCTASFLEYCNNNYNLNLIYLKTNRDTRKVRYGERGSNQNETWLAGRESKISNILGNMELKFVTEMFPHENSEDQKKLVDYIVSLV